MSKDEKKEVNTSKKKEDLGESFIAWYEIIDVKDNEDVLAKEGFDFETKIKKDTKLKAVYENAPETITITFDSRGGSKVNSITIEKGTKLNLPSNPTYKGYNFVVWETNVKVNIEKDLSARFYGSNFSYNDSYIGSSQTVKQEATR